MVFLGRATREESSRSVRVCDRIIGHGRLILYGRIILPLERAKLLKYFLAVNSINVHTNINQKTIKTH